MKVNPHKTSSRLDKELSHYKMDKFPDELKQQLNSAMSNPNFDPDKLAEALEKARANQENTNEEEPSVPERCPWYVAVCRLCVLIGSVLFLFSFFLCGVLFVFHIQDSLWGWSTVDWIFHAIQTHPVLAIIAAIIGFCITLAWFVNKLVSSFVGDRNSSAD